MEDHTSLERVQRNQVVFPPTAVPVSSYPLEVEPEGSLPSLLEYWAVLRKRRWTVISILLLVVVTVTIGTLKQRPVYRAKAVIQIDRESPNILTFQNFAAEMNPYDDSYLETAYKILESRSLAYRVISKLGLQDTADYAQKPQSSSWLSGLWGSDAKRKEPLSPEEQLDPKFTSAIDGFLDRLQVAPVRRSQLVELSYDSYEASQSARVTNALASTYIDMNLESRWEATQKASDWLSQQLVGLKAKLEKSEEDLQKYAKENSILFVDEKQNMNSQKLQQLQEEATRAEADLIQKESLYNQAKNGDFSSVPGIFENKLYQDLSLKLADLRREYSELTSTFTPEYPKVQRLKTQMDEIAGSLDREKRAFGQRIEDEYKAAANRKRLLDQAVAQQTRDFNQIAEKSIQYNILKREADTNKQLYDGLLQRLKEASVSAGLRASNVRVVDPAETPAYPSKPRKLLNFALSLFIGLSLGIGMAFFQEYLDSSLKTPEEVQRVLRVPTLGVIPSVGQNGISKLPYSLGGSQKALSQGGGRSTTNGAGKPDIIGLDANQSLAEAYRSLRTSVLLSTSGRQPRVMLITSAHPGEGKTTTAVNLAITLVQLGGRVLIVDSDMRRPRIATLLHLKDRASGLCTFLTGQHELDDVLVDTHIPNLSAACCGPIPPNPAELLSSALMQRFLESATQKFDFVILDSPPVLHVSDARILAPQVDAVILVAHGAVTPREAVKHAKQLLQQVNANVIGVALNNVDLRMSGSEYYYRHYGAYGQEYGYSSERREG